MRFQKTILIAGVLASGQVAASPEIQQCISDASERYKVHPYIIWAIAKTESSFRPTVIAKNTDGSVDIGLMQVNSWWLERRSSPNKPKRLGDYGVTKEQLLDPCTNIHAGAWVLAQNMKMYGNTWKAIGAYNAVTPWKQERYVRKVQKNLQIAIEKSKGAGLYQAQSVQEKTLKVVSR